MKTVSSESTLKGAGLAMIVGGIIAIITGVASLVDAALVSYAGNSSVLFAVACLALMSGVLAIVSGVVGLKHNENHEKAGVCIFWGAIVMALSLGSTVLSATIGEISVVNLVLGILLPALYIIAAADNRETAAHSQADFTMSHC